MADPAPASAPTPNYGFNMPAVGGDDNVWGGLLNDNWASIDTILWNVSGVASAALTPTTGDARYLQLTGGTLGPNSLIVNGPAQFANYVQFTGSSRFDCSIQANFTGGATFGTAQVFFNSPVTFSADALMVTPAPSDNSSRAATTSWVNAAVSTAIGAIPAPPAASNAAPAMNGTAAPGASALYSRGDHVHPSDTSRLALSGGTLTGPLTLAADPAANLQAATRQYVDAQVASAETASAYGGFVNRLRNATFDVWQRGTTATTIALAGPYYYADGWRVLPTGAAVTAQQGAGRNGTTGGPTNFSLGVTGAAGNTGVSVDQLVESYIAAPLAGATVTVQAQILNQTGATITPTLTIATPTARDNYASSTIVVNAVALQPCPNAVFTRVAYTFAMPTTAGAGVRVMFALGALAAGQSVFITEADLRVTPGVAVGLNANPPPPELRPIGLETSYCKRYYQTAGVQLAGWAGAANQVSASQYLLTAVMRATPTLTTGWTQQLNCTGAINAIGFGGYQVLTTATAIGAVSAIGSFTASAEL